MCSNQFWWSVFRWRCVGDVGLLSLCSHYVLPLERESRAVLDSGFHAANSRFQVTGFQSLSMELGFWIPIDCGIPDSLSCILDSKTQDSRFQKQKFPRFRNPDSLTLGDMSDSFCARTKTISGRASVHILTVISARFLWRSKAAPRRSPKWRLAYRRDVPFYTG